MKRINRNILLNLLKILQEKKFISPPNPYEEHIFWIELNVRDIFFCQNSV